MGCFLDFEYLILFIVQRGMLREDVLGPDLIGSPVAADLITSSICESCA